MKDARGDLRLAHIERVGGAAIADGVDAVLKASREQLMLGALQLKLMAAGGVTSTYDPIDATQYTEPELRAAVEAAENWGTYVMVHAYTPRSIQQALRAGVRCIERGQLMDEETVEVLVGQVAWWCLQPFLGDEDANPKAAAQQAKGEMVARGTVTAYEVPSSMAPRWRSVPTRCSTPRAQQNKASSWPRRAGRYGRPPPRRRRPSAKSTSSPTRKQTSRSSSRMASSTRTCCSPADLGASRASRGPFRYIASFWSLSFSFPHEN
jgi:hypothetical protein